jgi:integrase
VKEPVAEGVVYLTLPQQYRLLASYNKAARAVAITLCYQGLRTGEALALEWRHINFKLGTLFVAKSKSGHSRTIPLHPIVQRRLCRIWAKRGQPTQGRVFLSSRGQPYRIPNEAEGDTQGGNPLTRAHMTAREKAGIDFPFRVHDWRHNWASHMVMSGCDLFTLMRLGGWRTPRMVQRYAAVSTDHMAAAMKRMR